VFNVEKLEWCGYPYLTVKKYEDMITRFDTILERDRQQDGQTPHDAIGCAYT